MAVQEGEDATLTCKATGNPQPRVTWRREDGEMILLRKSGSRELMRGRFFPVIYLLNDLFNCGDENFS